jgi:2-dehydro-3-deoxyphosphogluconate aldolase/(4S)-4-hydroxy-2-oxoglutarate aldolase
MDTPAAFLERLGTVGVVAVIRGSSAADGLAMCRALLAGGVRGIELTYTTPGCCDVLAELKAEAPADAVLGVGTVRTPAQIEAAVEAGAAFAVSPHFEPEIICAALEAEIPYLPGAITPTEIVQAWESGAVAVKVFPASAVGPEFLKAVRAPLSEIPLMPTGGVSVSNMAAWFDAGAVAVGMGGKLVTGPPEEIRAAAAATVAELARIRAAR